MIRVYINNEWQSFNELKAPPIKTAIDDSLDTATVIFYADFKEAIEKNTLVNVQNKIMCVYNDQSIPIAKNSNKWQHTLSLIETTHLLDLIFCNNICLTNTSETFYQQLVKLTENIGFFCDFFINSTQLHPNLINAVNGLNSAEIYCINLTARECFNELLRTINARIELQVQYVANSETPIQYWLNYRSGSKRNNLVEFEEMSSLYTYDSNTMTNNLTFIGQNAVTRYPITQGYEGFKTTETTLTSDNAQIILMHDIEDIVSFKVMFNATYNIKFTRISDNYYDTKNYTKTVQDVELINYFIEQEAYDLLTSSEQQEKIPYSKSNFIQTGSINLLRTILYGTGSKLAQIAEIETENFIEKDILNYIDAEDLEIRPQTEWYYTVYSVITPELQNIAYQITYYPFLNVYGNLTKNANKETIFTIVDNQQEEVLSLEKYSDLLDSKVKRIGNMEIEIDEINQPIKELNDYTEDGYVIYEREIAQATNEVKVHYKLSKDYNLLNNRIAVDQKKRLFEIPLNYQDCYLTQKHIMRVSTKSDETQYMNFFSTNLKIACISTLLGRVFSSSLPDVTYTSDYSIRGILFTTKKDGEEIATKYLSCSTYAFKDSIHFSMLTYDNYSAALSVGGQVLGGKRAIYNPYCDEYGEFDTMRYSLCIKNPTTYVERHIAYPDEIAAGQQESYEFTELHYHKDRTQRICLDISAEIKSIDDDVILGKEFFQNNLILQNSIVPTLYFYYSIEETYEPFSTKALGEKASFTITDGFKATYNSGLTYLEPIANFPPTIKSWAIADINGNIYIAVNGNVKPIYFY